MALCLLIHSLAQDLGIHKVSHTCPAVIARSGLGRMTQGELHLPSNSAFLGDKERTEMRGMRRIDWPKLSRQYWAAFLVHFALCACSQQ